jgi:hypothetical protein
VAGESAAAAVPLVAMTTRTASRTDECLMRAILSRQRIAGTGSEV